MCVCLCVYVCVCVYERERERESKRDYGREKIYERESREQSILVSATYLRKTLKQLILDQM